MNLNYNEDSMTIGKVEYSLKKYRWYLLNEYPDLCKAYFIKSIRVGSETIFTYDWMAIYSRARELNIHIQFIKHESNS